MTIECKINIKDTTQLLDYLYPLKPKKGFECVNKDEILCQLVVFAGDEVKKIAVLLSVNHPI